METILELGDCRLPARLPGAPRLVDGGVLVPAGDVHLLHPFGATSFYRHGWNSFSPTSWWPLDGEPLGVPAPDRRLTTDDAAHDSPWRHTGSAVGALEGPDGNVLLLGALGLDAARIEADERVLTGRFEHPDADWFLAYGPERQVFDRYAELLGQRLGRREGQPTLGNVWCSWYSYFEDITEALLHQTLQDLRAFPFDVAQVDDGWHRCVGDWEAGPDFPSGMADLAERISECGFTPGLWLAPFIAPAGSETLRTRPHLFLCDDSGTPQPAGANWGEVYFALDTTLPETQDHLQQTFEKVRGWGYRYLKLDFLAAGALRGRRRQDRPREQVYRDAISLIRNVAGDDTYLLGSGAPILPSLGILDGIRIGPDVAPYWANTQSADDRSSAGARNAIANCLHRLWLRSVVDIDPDPVFFRSRYNLLDAPTRQALTDLAHICGRRATSDPISWLDPGEQTVMTRFLTYRPVVQQVGRYRFTIDGRDADFGPLLNPDSRVSDRLVVKA